MPANSFSAVRIQEVQNNYVWVEAELRLLFIRFCSQHRKFYQGVLNFLERCSKDPECAPNDYLLGELGGSKTRKKILMPCTLGGFL